jgi:hypothetical protein
MGFWIWTSNFVLFVVNGLIKGESEKVGGQLLGLIVMSHWLGEVWIQIWDSFDGFTFILVSFGESRLLVSWCAGDRWGMAGNDKDRGRSRRPGAEDRGWSHKSGTWWPDDREIRWHCVRPAPCTRRRGMRVSWFGLKTNVDGLSMVQPQNH